MTDIEGLREKVASLIGQCADIKVTYDSVGRQYTHIANSDELSDSILSLVQGGGSSSWDQSSRESTGAGWQPIATAPKAETDSEPPICLLLAWFSLTETGGHSYSVGEGYWHPTGERFEEGGWWWANTAPGDYYSSPIEESITGRVAYWQPLPAAPAPALDTEQPVIPRAEPETASPPPPGGEAVTSWGRELVAELRKIAADSEHGEFDCLRLPEQLSRALDLADALLALPPPPKESGE